MLVVVVEQMLLLSHAGWMIGLIIDVAGVIRKVSIVAGTEGNVDTMEADKGLTKWSTNGGETGGGQQHFVFGAPQTTEGERKRKREGWH